MPPQERPISDQAARLLPSPYDRTALIRCSRSLRIAFVVEAQVCTVSTVSSEADKLHTKRLEKAAADQKGLERLPRVRPTVGWSRPYSRPERSEGTGQTATIGLNTEEEACESGHL